MDNSLTGLGTANSYAYVGPRWAEVSSTPFHLWKGTAGEGGTTAPAIVKLPQQTSAQASYHGFASVLDVLPTVLEYANIAVPKDQYKGRTINTPSGISWKATLENKAQSIRTGEFSFADELHGYKYAKQGDWKIAFQADPALGTSKWELYNLKQDRSERNNLADTYPDQVAKLVDVYNKYATQNGVLEYKQ